MSPSSIRCPHCDTAVKVKDGVPPGARIACPKCKKPIVVPALAGAAPAGAKKPAPAESSGAVRSKPPAANARKSKDEKEEARPTPKKKKKRKKDLDRTNVIIGGAVGGFVVVAGVITAIVVANVKVAPAPVVIRPPVVAEAPKDSPPPPVRRKAPDRQLVAEPPPVKEPSPTAAPPPAKESEPKSAVVAPPAVSETRHFAIIRGAGANFDRVIAALDAIKDEKSAIECSDVIDRETKDLQQLGRELRDLGAPDAKDKGLLKSESRPIIEKRKKITPAVLRFGRDERPKLPAAVGDRLEQAIQRYTLVEIAFSEVAVKQGI